MSKDKYHKLVFRSNEDVASALLLSLHREMIDSDRWVHKGLKF